MYYLVSVTEASVGGFGGNRYNYTWATPYKSKKEAELKAQDLKEAGSRAHTIEVMTKKQFEESSQSKEK